MNISRFIHAAAWAAAFTIGLLGAVPAHGQTTYVNKVRGSNGRDQCLAVKDGRIANDSRLILWDCIPGDLSQTFWYGSSNLLHVGGPSSQFCVAAYDRVQNASRVGVWQCQPGDPTQTFSQGIYADIFAVGTNFCLGVQNGSNVPGSPVILWSCNKRGNDDQSWSVNRVGSAPAPQPLPSLAISPRPTGNTTVLNYNGTRLSPSFLGPGGYILSSNSGTIVAAGGGNFIDSKTGLLISRNGSPLLIGYQVISNDGGSIVAAGGGNLVAAGGGNLVAAGAGNLLASANGFSVYNPASVTTLLQQMNNALLQPSQVQLARGAFSGIATNNGANYGAPAAVISPNGSTYHVQSVGAVPAANNGVCHDPLMTKAIQVVARRAPKGSGDTGECALNLYGGTYGGYPDLVVRVARTLGWPGGGNCRDAWITQATVEVRGVLPSGSGDRGQCDARNYNHGQWANYPALVGGVKAYYGLR